MARFENLNDAGLALVGLLQRNLAPALSDILAAQPIENPDTAAEAIRISLMWVALQDTHRNDPWENDDTGQRLPPPVSLSGFYLVTTYGVSDTGEPSIAINRLGQVIQTFETEAILDLPLPVVPGTDPTPGEGRMTIVQMSNSADLMEKLYTPLQMRHRPWAMFEVGPIQLQRLAAPLPAPVPVRPGGVGLDVRLASQPRILRATPDRVRAGGRLRLDTAEAASATALVLGPSLFAVTPAPAGPLDIPPPDAEGRLFATPPAASAPGTYDAVLRSPAGPSEPAFVTVLAADTAGLDAPDAPHAPGGDLTLTGGALDQTERAFLWPDGPVRDPGQVLDIAPSAVGPGSVTLQAADLAGLGPGTWRVSVRSTAGTYTPFVLLEAAP